MEHIVLNWSRIENEKEALSFFKELDQQEKTLNPDYQKANGFEADFRDKFAVFKEDKDLSWNQAQPLVIC